MTLRQITVVFLIGVLGFFSGCLWYFDECHFHLPKGFLGDITIHFGMDGYPELKKAEDGNYHIKVDSTGSVYTSTSYEDYFDYQGEYFQWEGGEALSFQELKKSGVIESKASKGQSESDGWATFDKYVIYFVEK